MMISVLICSHNPKKSIFEQVLKALKAQTLEFEKWEIILIDNCSVQPLISWVDLSWHPNAYIEVEPVLGLTHARLRGIKLSVGEILVFVDDDNILDPDYLNEALKIVAQKPYIGAFGGNLLPEFEVEPIKAILPHLSFLAIRDVSNEVISNDYGWDGTPYGAGLVIRKTCAQLYAKKVSNNFVLINLGRNGNNLMSAEDIDMAFTSIDMGFSNGLFPQLKLKHYIPATRIDPNYLCKLIRYSVISSSLLFYVRFGRMPAQYSRIKFYQGIIKNFFLGESFEISVLLEKRRAIKLAKGMIKELVKN